MQINDTIHQIIIYSTSKTALYILNFISFCNTLKKYTKKQYSIVIRKNIFNFSSLYFFLNITHLNKIKTI